MGKGISVKVQRVKVINALMSKLDDMEYQKAQYDIAYDKYEEAKVNHKNAVADVALKYLSKATNLGKNTSMRTSWRDDSVTTVELSIDIPTDKLPKEPEGPKNPFQSYGHGRNYVGNYDDRRVEILNAINILQLSDEDTVSTATYASVAKYL